MDRFSTLGDATTARPDRALLTLVIGLCRCKWVVLDV
jgi:hypothetical protein